MAWKDMQQAQILHGDERWPAFESSIEKDTFGVSEWVLIPDKVQNVSITITFTGGATGTVQTSTDKVDTIKTGVPLAISWPFGVVGVDTQKACYPPSAIRIFQIAAGTMAMTIRAN